MTKTLQKGQTHYSYRVSSRGVERESRRATKKEKKVVCQPEEKDLPKQKNFKLLVVVWVMKRKETAGWPGFHAPGTGKRRPGIRQPYQKANPHGRELGRQRQRKEI